ncbi:MAG: flippase-like domain-containing protein [Candidatus Bathyarchaeota archaeon]|nr:MAG: flippase-like domain-containing protein [Candidatus Bathyarchaeota archaeon]
MNEKPRVLMKVIPFLLIGILAFILYLYLFVDIPQMIQVIQNTNLLIYSVATLMLFVEAFLFTLSWRYLLLPLSVKVPLRRLLAYMWIGVFADLLIPAESISGEIAKVYLVSQEPDASPGKVLASLVGQRMLGTIATMVTLLIAFTALVMLNYPLTTLVLHVLLIIAFASVIALVFLIVVCIQEDWTKRLINKILRFFELISRGRFKAIEFRSRIVETLKAFYNSLRTFASEPSKLLAPSFFFALTWLASIMVVFLVFAAIGYLQPSIPILFLEVAVVSTLLVGIRSIPLGIPAEVGLPDIAMAGLFTLFGIPLDISAAATILTRILTVWIRFLIGFIAIQWLGFKRLAESGVFGKT